MAHSAIGHLEALKKKEFLLAALLMNKEEFDNLTADREKLIVELPSNNDRLISDAPNKLIVGAADNQNTCAVASSDTSGGGGGLWGVRRGFSSINSGNKCRFMVSLWSRKKPSIILSVDSMILYRVSVGLSPNQAHISSPLMWGERRCAYLGLRQSVGNGMG